MDAQITKAAQTKAVNYTILEADNRDTIEVSATATITLPDAATIAAASDTGDFEVTIKNVAGTTTIGRVTGADTIDGIAADIVMAVVDSVTLKVNQAGNGYSIIAGGVSISGKVLTSPIINGTATGDAVDTIISSTEILGTPVTLSSGLTQDFTIPSGAKRIQLLLNDVVCSASAIHGVQIGDAGGIETAGYTCRNIRCIGTGLITYSASGYIHVAFVPTAGATSGVITLINISGNSWVFEGALASETTASFNSVAGRKTLTAELTTVRLLITTGTFSSGTLNVLYSF